MRSTIHVVVIFYICLTSYTSSSSSQDGTQRTAAVRKPSTSTETNAGNGTTTATVQDTTPRNVSEPKDEPSTGGSAAKLSGKSVAYTEYQFNTHVELNVKQAYKNDKCCGELSPSLPELTGP